MVATPPRLCRFLAVVSWVACAALGAGAPNLHLSNLGNAIAIASSMILELKLSWTRWGLLLGGWLRSAFPKGEALGSFTNGRAMAPRRFVSPPVNGLPAASSSPSAAPMVPRQGHQDPPRDASPPPRAEGRPMACRTLRRPLMGKCGSQALARQGEGSTLGLLQPP